MGFIGYRRMRNESGDDVVRIFLECRDEPPSSEDAGDAGVSAAAHAPKGPISYTFSVDLVFPSGDGPCQIRGVDGILVLKKFYKLVHSLEERAREHGHDRGRALASADGVVEHLGYTRNARDLGGLYGRSEMSGAGEIGGSGRPLLIRR